MDRLVGYGEFLRSISTFQKLMWVSVAVAATIILAVFILFALQHLLPSKLSLSKSPIEGMPLQKSDILSPPSVVSHTLTGNHNFQMINSIVINIAGGEAVRKDVYSVTGVNGSAVIEIYLLFDRAAWAYGNTSEFVDKKNRSLSLSSFLDDQQFYDEASQYNAIVCLGLASAHSDAEESRGLEISDERALHLCGLISKKRYIDLGKTKVFGLPLGYHKDKTATKGSRQERDQRGIVIIGVKSSSGDMEGRETKEIIISEILRSKRLNNFDAENYSEVSASRPLRFLEIKRTSLASPRALSIAAVNGAIGETLVH